jgi:hypothetical protein
MALGDDGRRPVQNEFTVSLGTVRHRAKIQEAGRLFSGGVLGHFFFPSEVVSVSFTDAWWSGDGEDGDVRQLLLTLI